MTARLGLFWFALGFGIIFMPALATPAMIGRPLGAGDFVVVTLGAVFCGLALLTSAGTRAYKRERAKVHIRRRILAQKLHEAGTKYRDVRYGIGALAADTLEQFEVNLFAGPTFRALSMMTQAEDWPASTKQEGVSQLLTAQGMALDYTEVTKAAKVETAWLILCSGAIRLNRDDFTDDEVNAAIRDIERETADFARTLYPPKA